MQTPIPTPDLLTFFNTAKGQVAQAVQLVGQQDFVSQTLIVIKRVSLVLTIIFGTLFIFMIIKLRRFIAEQVKLIDITPPSPDEGGPFMARWEEIKRHIASDKDAQWKLAIIEADATIENVLKNAGFTGDTMGEKLKLITRDQLRSIDDLWFAHKIRNEIAHNPDVAITQSDSIEVISRFEKVLKELGVLQ